MIIDKNILDILEERRSIIERASFQVFYENDEGLIPLDNGEDDEGGLWYIEEPMQPQPAEEQPAEGGEQLVEGQPAEGEGQPAEEQPAGEQPAGEQPAEGEEPQIDEDDIVAIQISQTQEIFTKIYLIQRLEKLKKYLENLIDLMELKYDIDEFDQLKRIAMYVGILDEIALTLPADTLYHMIVGFEFDLLELIQKISNIIDVPKYDIPMKGEDNEGLYS